jgi:predicted NodU family carbamoyl transferase
MIFGKYDLKKADLDKAKKSKHASRIYVGSERNKDLTVTIAGLLAAGNVVNIKRSGQEFGPRALCHTTTLALPTKKLSHEINVMNARNEVMPMAPVMSRNFLQQNSG